MSATQIYFNPWAPDFYANPYPHYAPLQTRRRRLVSRDFTPKPIREMEARVREITARLLDAVQRKGEFDSSR